jgi:putative spermidine/putrescine transport system ATP-binding protein
MTSTFERPTAPTEGTTDMTPADDVVLSLRDVRKRYGDATVVDGISLDVRQGEFVTLLGPSGSGKTTTLNMIAGFVEESGGVIALDGKPIGDLPTHRRNIGVVFQHYALFPHLTAEQNIAFPLKRRRVAAAEQARRVQEALEMVKLGSFGKRYPRELSGGQQQRVALARALVFDPRLVLMDEPLGALDKKLREWLQGEIQRIHRASGITFIYVTHDQDEALALSDRVAVFNDGRIEQFGTPDELYEHPRSVFVAEFLGESNCFNGTAEPTGDGEWALRCDALTLRAPAPAVPLGDATRATVIVRPERMRLLRRAEEAPSGANVLPGTVEQIVYLGAARRVTVALPTGEPATVREPAGVAEPLQVGEPVELCWHARESTLLPHADVDLEAELQSM